MDRIPIVDELPAPPGVLSYGDVVIRFDQIEEGDPAQGHVPYYHFRIMAAEDQDVGHINFRVGHTDHVEWFAGHVGFRVHPAFRGRGFAGQACRALAPFVRSLFDTVIITCDPDNTASRKTIEGLGARFIEEIHVSVSGHRSAEEPHIKRRYRWSP